MPLVRESFGTPTRCGQCGALTREDTIFSATAARYSQPQRRYVCAMGHSVYTSLPAIPPPKASMGSPVQLPGQVARHERACARCGDIFMGTKRQKFCSSVCTRAADAERNRRYLSASKTGKRLSPEALRLARAMPGPFGRGRQSKTPVPYAPRSSGLDTRWTL